MENTRLSATAEKFKANFAVEVKLEAFYTTGKIEISSDGKHLFSICGRDLKVVNIETGKSIKTISGEYDQILNFTLSSDDKVLVTSLFSGVFQQWEWETDTLLKTWKGTHKGPVSCMTLDSTGTLLLTGGTDSTIKVWDVVGHYITHNLTGGHGVFSVVTYHPNPNRYVVFGAADDHHIRVWELHSSTCMSVLKGHMSIVTSLVFTEDGRYMLSSGRDKIVIIWDIEFGIKSIKTIPIFETLESVIPIHTEEVLPEIGIEDLDGMKFITAGSSGLLKVWSDKGKLLFTQKEGITRPGQVDGKIDDGQLVLQAFYHKATDRLVVVTFEQHIVFYKLGNLQLVKELVGYNDEVLDITYIGEKQTHFAVATNSTYIKIFEVDSLDCKLLKGHTKTVLSLDTFPKNPDMMVSASMDDSIRIWKMDAVTKNVVCLATGFGYSHKIGTVACSRLNSSFVVSGSSDKCLKLWNLPATLSKTSNLKKPTVVQLTTKWSLLAHDSDINSVCASPNDRLLASGSQDKTVKVWSATNAKLLGTMTGHRRGVWCVQFSPVDQVVASSGGDGRIKIWSLSDFSCVKTFESQGSSVLKVTFVTRGMQLLSSSSDGLIQLWTIKLNECIKTLDNHSGKVWALRTNKSDTGFISGGDDSTIILWKDVTEEEKEQERIKQDELIQQEQVLQNLLQEKKFRKALVYCIRLEQPSRALKVVRELLLLPNGKEQLETALNDFRDDQVDVLLRFASNWNTNSRNCYEAQHVVNVVLRKYTIDELLKFPNIQSVVQGLVPYTERHFQRYSRLLQQASFIEYTWQRMKLAEKL